MFFLKASSLGFSLSSSKGFFAAFSEIQSQDSFRVESAAKNGRNIHPDWMIWLKCLLVGLLGTAVGLVLLAGLHSVMA